MTLSSPRSNVPRITFAAVMISLMAGTAGCAASASDAAPTPAPTVTVTVAPVREGGTDVESCEAFSDVLTVLHNITVASMEGRMSDQELRGWKRLATRELDRIPTSGEGPVSDAIATLKEGAPAIKSGTDGTSEIGSPEWYASAELAAACEAAGAPLSAEGFVGG